LNDCPEYFGFSVGSPIAAIVIILRFGSSMNKNMRFRVCVVNGMFKVACDDWTPQKRVFIGVG
jgi:hypothetical protein